MEAFLEEVRDTLRWIDESDEPLAFDKNGLCCISQELQAYFRLVSNQTGSEVTLSLCQRVAGDEYITILDLVTRSSYYDISDVTVKADKGVLRFLFEYSKKSFLSTRVGKVCHEEVFDFGMSKLGSSMKIVA